MNIINKKMAVIAVAMGVAILLAFGGKFFLLDKSASESVVDNSNLKKDEINLGEISTKEVAEFENSASQNEEHQIAVESASATDDVSVKKNEEETEKKVSENNKADSEEKNDIEIINNLVAFGFEKNSPNRKIDTIIVHSTYCVGDDPFDFQCALGQFKDYGVSSHYIINREGVIYRLVADNDIAYHAGKSQVPDGRENVNDFSIGIEIINTEKSKPTSAQYFALNSLITNLKQKYSIKYTLGHKDIAAGRKTDPWNFDWSKIQ